jgi:starch synthase
MINVLAAIIVPPHLSVSGGARAGERLTAALADRCNITIANMMTAGAPSHAIDHVARHQVRVSLPPLLPWSRFPNRFSTLFYRSDIPALIRQSNFDLVHIHNPMPALEMERVARACLARGVPYVVSTHGFNEVANGGQIYGFDPVKRMLWKHLVRNPVARTVSKASGILALSPADFPIIREMGYSGEELSVVPNGVECPAIVDATTDGPVLQRLGIPATRQAGQITCMFLANHTPNKGLPVLLEAFTKLDRPYLLIVGGEKRQTVDYQSFVDRCRPGQRIVITGRLSDAEVGAVFRRSDLFVFPTLADTFPLVVLEAMSHGLPVLASRVGGIPHQIDETCGQLVEPGSSPALTAAIERLAAEPERLQPMGQAGRSIVAQRFSWSEAASQALHSYHRVLRSNARASQDSSPGTPTLAGSEISRDWGAESSVAKR